MNKIDYFKAEHSIPIRDMYKEDLFNLMRFILEEHERKIEEIIDKKIKELLG